MAGRFDVLRVSVGEGVGTGFLVAPDRMITALHVVGTPRSERLELYGSVEVSGLILRSGEYRRPTQVLGEKDIQAFDLHRDWICFRVDRRKFEGVPIFALGGGTLAVRDEWETYGFPEVASSSGMATTGSVASTGAMLTIRSRELEVLQLFSLEAAAGVGAAVWGFSGAPVIVRGEVVGHLSSAITADGQHAAAGTIFAVPAAPFAGRLELPLGGLPPLPSLALPEKPFRGLQRYEAKQAPVFWGRSREIQRVIAALREKAGPVLLTGQTGSGKSSLLEAGVLPRLEERYDVRRARIEKGSPLRAAWQTVTQGKSWVRDEDPKRPWLVVLDQVEEAWGEDGAELVEWLKQDYAECLEKGRWRPAGQLILAFRREWLADVQGAFRAVGLPSPSLVHLPPLDHTAVLEIVTGVGRLDEYHTTVEADLPATIANALLSDPDSPRAPTLQAWLTELYEAETSPSKVLSVQGFEHLIRRGKTLGDFLDRQLQAVPESYVKSGLALDMLAFHVGPLSTAIGRTKLEREAAYGDLPHREVVTALDKARLLVPLANKDGFRLVHDTLGPVVLERIATSPLPAQRALRVLQLERVEWRTKPRVADSRRRLGLPLDPGRLKTVREGIRATRRLSEDDTELLEASQANAVVELASESAEKNPLRALAELTQPGLEVISPSLDRVALALEAQSAVVPLAAVNCRTASISKTGDLAALATDRQVWLIRLPNRQSFAVSFANAVGLTCSPSGRWVLAWSDRAVSLVNAQTGATTPLDLKLSAPGQGSDKAFVSDDGTVFVALPHALAIFKLGAERPWTKRRRKDDYSIHSIRGVTSDGRYLVCQEEYGGNEFVTWFDADGKDGSYRLPSEGRFELHPHRSLVAVYDKRDVTVVDLATRTRVWILENVSKTQSIDAVVFDQAADNAQPWVIRRRYNIAEIVCGNAEPRGFALPEEEKLLAVQLDDELLHIATQATIRCARGSDFRVATVQAIENFASKSATIELTRNDFPPSFVASSDFALLSVPHGDHCHIHLADGPVSQAFQICASTRIAAFASNGTGVIVADERAWLLGQDVRPKREASLRINGQLSAFAADKCWISDSAGAVSVFDRAGGQDAGKLPLVDGESLACFARGRTLLLAATDRGLIRGMVDSGTLPFQLEPLPAMATRAPDFAAISPGDGWLLLGHADNPNEAFGLTVWDLRRGPPVRPPIPLAVSNIGACGPHFAFSADGRHLATSTDDPVVIVWDLAGESPLQVAGFQQQEVVGAPWVLGLAFTETGNLVVVWSSGRVELCDLITGTTRTLYRDTDRGADPIKKVAFSPNGHYCVASSRSRHHLICTDDATGAIDLPGESGADPIALDNQARWVVWGRTAMRWLSAIDPQGHHTDTLPLDRPTAVHLAPDGNQVSVVDLEEGVLRIIALDATQALRSTVRIPASGPA